MTTPDANREPGYRGTLPTREDRMARPWILVVIAIFLLIMLLSLAGIPSRLIPEPTLVPVPSLPPATEPADPSPSVEPSPEDSPEAS